MGSPGAHGSASAATRPIDTAWTAVAMLIPVLVILLLPKLGTVDLAYHLRAGGDILDTGSIPRSDTYTFTAMGAPWVDQQWGSQVILTLLHRAGSWSLLVAARAALAGLSFGVLFAAVRSRAGSVPAACALTLGGFLIALPTLALRPQLVALPLFAGGLLAVVVRERHPRAPWALPLLACAAANLHGSFTLFPLLAGWVLVENGSRRRGSIKDDVALVVVTTAATLVNPFGIAIWTYAYDLSTDPIIRERVTEWEPVALADPAGALTLASVVAITAYLARRRAQVPWVDLLVLGTFLVMALAASRAIVWWAMVAPLVIAGLIRSSPRSADEDDGKTTASGSRVPAYAIVATLVLAIVLFLPWTRGAREADLLDGAPAGITSVVRELPDGTRLLAHQPWGSWFEYATPGMRLFVDSRIEILPADVWEDYSQVGFAGAGWRDVLDEWSVDTVVADAETWDLIPFLRADPSWTVAYEDDEGVVFVRS